MNRAPRRLLDDPDVAVSLREDLANARAVQASFDAEQGLATLRGALHGVDARAAWGESVRAVGARWWGLAATGVATVGAVWWIQHASPVQSTPRAVSDIALRAPLREAPTPMVQSPAKQAEPPAPNVKRARPLTRRSTPVEAPPTATREVTPEVAPDIATDVAPRRVHPPAPSDTPPNELEHLARLRRLLAKEPREALAAARDGQARFARGLFVEERAGMIVFALDRLGEQQDALREGRRFLRLYPEGLFAARVRVIVARLEGTKG